MRNGEGSWYVSVRGYFSEMLYIRVIVCVANKKKNLKMCCHRKMSKICNYVEKLHLQNAHVCVKERSDRETF